MVTGPSLLNYYTLHLLPISIFIFASFVIFNSYNLITSLLALILIYIGTFYYFLLMNFDYIGIIFIQLYVGAVAVLFLFILMTVETTQTLAHYEEYYIKNLNINYFRVINIFILFLFIAMFLILNPYCLMSSDIFNNEKTLQIIDIIDVFNKTNPCQNCTVDAMTEALLGSEFKIFMLLLFSSIPRISTHFNIDTLGLVLYTFYSKELLIFGWILLMGLLGCLLMFTQYRKKN